MGYWAFVALRNIAEGYVTEKLCHLQFSWQLRKLIACRNVYFHIFD